MKAVYDFNGVTLYQGDSSAVLQALPDRSVHCAITSPPYFNLRDYRTGTWEGGSAQCDHKAVTPKKRPELVGGGCSSWSTRDDSSPYADTCGKCGARRVDKQIGLEASPAAHLEALLRVFSECWRVLRDDGVLLINYGDSYACKANGRSAAEVKALGVDSRTFRDKPFSSAGFLPAKNLLGLPWRLAFALQESGWILRSCLPWFKVNSLPESVSDRASVAHEYVFLLTKRGRYWYDADAVRRPAPYGRREWTSVAGIMASIGGGRGHGTVRGADPSAGRSFRTSDAYPLALADQLEAVDAEVERLSLLRCHLENLGEARGLLTDTDGEPLALNLVSEPSREAHFATFGTNLVKPLLLSCCPETVCAVCGAGYARAVSISSSYDGQRAGQEVYTGQAYGDRPQSAPRGAKKNFGETHREDRGFSASCGCNAGTAPGVVLDPFMGTGTVAYVARALGRRAIGIELSSEYLEIARRR